jgi:hypothetical protein
MTISLSIEILFVHDVGVTRVRAQNFVPLQSQPRTTIQQQTINPIQNEYKI